MKLTERLKKKWEGIPPPKKRGHPKPRPVVWMRQFHEAPIGKFFREYAFEEYMVLTENRDNCWAPGADLLENISYASTNPVFRLFYFRKLLIDYRANFGKTYKVPFRPLNKSEALKVIAMRSEGLDKKSQTEL